GIVRATAIAGIDLALWDILGKVCGVPCAKLWGGPVRDHVRTYCHLGGGRMEDFYETAAEDARRFADLARQAVADGFTAFKCMAVPPTMPLQGLRPIRTGEKSVAAMLEAVGDGIDIMVDCHARPSPATGVQIRRARDPHSPQRPVSTAGSLEFGFAQPSYVICETAHADVPWRQDVVREGFTVEPKGRLVRPKRRPGLGIEIDEAEVAKHPFEQELPQRVFYPDGSVGDW